MKKNALAIALLLTMVVSLLASCSGGTTSGNANTPAPATPAPTTSGNEATPAPTEPAIDDQLTAIQNAGKLIVGVEGTYYPFTYHDEETDELTGYDIEVAKAVAEQLGVEVEFMESEWDSLLMALDTGHVDTVINDVTATDERREKYDFSDPYFYSARQVVVKTGNEVGLHSLEDLNGKKIATNATNSWVGRLEELGVEIVPIDNTDQCATMVETGRVDFCMFNTIVLGEYMKQHPEAQLEVAFVIEEDINEVAIPARKGETRFLEEVNKALAELRDSGKLLELSEKYFGGNFCDDPRVK